MIAELLAAAALTATAPPTPTFSLGTTTAVPGDEVVVHATLPARLRPLRLYLVPQALARGIRSRFDQHAAFVGVFGRTALTFTAPPLDSGVYTLSYWCRACSRPGRTLIVARGRTLRIQMPSATETCPVTVTNGKGPPGLPPAARAHGNRLLGAFIGDGEYPVGADGTAFEKMIWVATPASWAPLSVTYRRIDTLEPARSAEVIKGNLSTFSGPSWASRLYFTAGCWKVAGRLRDVSLAFVVKVSGSRS
jgi:hypothetical protein